MSHINRITFEVRGVPVAKGRPKMGKFGVYTPEKTVNAERSLLAQALPYKPETPWEGAIAMDVIAIFARPKSHYRTGKNSHILKDDAPEYHIVKPDVDNLDKLVKDALNEVFFKDDCQIMDSHIEKYYGDVPKLKITLWKKFEER